MKNKLLLLILPIIVIFLLVSSTSFAFACNEQKLQFNSDGSFKIVVFPDCHSRLETAEILSDFIDYAIETEQPDLVVFTGDNVRNGNPFNFIPSISSFLFPIIKRDIPYAYTYGNHDHQNGLTHNMQYCIYRHMGKCLTRDPNPFISGTGTCSIPIYSSTDNSRMNFNLYMLDSYTLPSYLVGHYDLQSDEVAWVIRKNERLKKLNDGFAVPSIVFQHICFPEAAEILKLADPGDEVTKDYNGKLKSLELEESLKPYWREDFYLNTFPELADTNVDEFEKFASCGNIIGVFHGHDHTNCYSLPLTDEKSGNTVYVTAMPGMNIYQDKRSVYAAYSVIELSEDNLGAFIYRTESYSDYLNIINKRK